MEKVKYVLLCCAGMATLMLVGFACQKSPQAQIKLEDLGPLDSKPIPAPPPVEQLVVHVTGAVKKPGVYKLKENARVHDAIREAGGAKPHADLDVWNLAAKVKDGMQINISAKAPAGSKPSAKTSSRSKGAPPRAMTGNLPVNVEVPEGFRSQPTTELQPENPSEPSRPRTAKKEAPPAGSVSLNSSNAQELQRLPGVGPSTAEKIIEYRQQNGPFSSIDELLAVKGIGPKKLEAMRKYLRL